MRWIAKEGSYGNYIKIVDADTGKTVARVPWGDGDSDNARLIESAPQLRAALEHTTRALRGLLSSRGQHQVTDARMALSEALKIMT